MSRKLKKGYYVKGQFVAEGSALDLEYKQELKGTLEPTRTELKRESAELQKVGEGLLELRSDLMARLQLPEKLVDAVAAARHITNFEGKRRQMQFIGKLMRLLDPATLLAVREALEEQHMPSARETWVLHESEQWRDRLIADEEAVGAWIQRHPAADSQQLRALVRQARKDSVAEKPGEALRHGRAYRDIFQLVREQLTQIPEPVADAAPGASEGYDGRDA